MKIKMYNSTKGIFITIVKAMTNYALANIKVAKWKMHLCEKIKKKSGNRYIHRETHKSQYTFSLLNTKGVRWRDILGVHNCEWIKKKKKKVISHMYHCIWPEKKFTLKSDIALLVATMAYLKGLYQSFQHWHVANICAFQSTDTLTLV